MPEDDLIRFDLGMIYLEQKVEVEGESIVFYNRSTRVGFPENNGTGPWKRGSVARFDDSDITLWGRFMRWLDRRFFHNRQRELERLSCLTR